MHGRLRRSPAPSPFDKAAALRALASLLRAGLTPHLALREWSSSLPGGLFEAAARTRRLVDLGASPRASIEAIGESFGEDIGAVRAAIELHSEIGADPVPMLERSAEMLEGRGDAHAAGRAAVSGAKLSGWMVGALPLVSLPLLPMARAPLFDGVGRAVLFFGAVLTAVGMLWMGRLVPRARPSDDPLALFADHVAAALEAGASLTKALEISSKHAPTELRSRLEQARRRARLGQPWPAALEEVDPEAFAEFSATVQRARRFGSPPRAALASFADARRAAAQRAFEREVRRAPVLMVLPLVLCVLHAFGLLSVVPFLRGIAFF